MLETIKIADAIVLIINIHGALDNEQEESIRKLVNLAFKEGYKDCLKDVRNGFIK